MLPFPRSLRSSLALPVLAVAAASLLAGPAHALSLAIHEVTLTLTLVSATYQDDGTDAFDLEGFGSSEVNLGTFVSGNAGQDGSSSFLLNGSAPADPGDFSFGPGDQIVATVMAQANAEGAGAQGTHQRELVLFLEFEDFGDGTRNILLDFEWSYTQDLTLANMTAGDQAAGFFDATASISNFESYFDETFFVVDENYGNSGADTDVLSLMGMGAFQFLMDVEGGGASASVVDVSIDVGANATILVPEPALGALLVPLGLLGAAGRRRSA